MALHLIACYDTVSSVQRDSMALNSIGFVCEKQEMSHFHNHLLLRLWKWDVSLFKVSFDCGWRLGKLLLTSINILGQIDWARVSVAQDAEKCNSKYLNISKWVDAINYFFEMCVCVSLWEYRSFLYEQFLNNWLEEPYLQVFIAFI